MWGADTIGSPRCYRSGLDCPSGLLHATRPTQHAVMTSVPGRCLLLAGPIGACDDSGSQAPRGRSLPPEGGGLGGGSAPPDSTGLAEPPPQQGDWPPCRSSFSPVGSGPRASSPDCAPRCQMQTSPSSGTPVTTSRCLVCECAPTWTP